jgi:hypothetical protein
MVVAVIGIAGDTTGLCGVGSVAGTALAGTAAAD